MIQPAEEHLIREAAMQWYAKKLPTLATMLIIYGLLYPERPSDKDIEWAQKMLGTL